MFGQYSQRFVFDWVFVDTAGQEEGKIWKNKKPTVLQYGKSRGLSYVYSILKAQPAFARKNIVNVGDKLIIGNTGWAIKYWTIFRDDARFLSCSTDNEVFKSLENLFNL